MDEIVAAFASRPGIAAPAPEMGESAPAGTVVEAGQDESLDVGRRVQAARRGQGLTLASAAAACGIGRSTLAKIEGGQMSPTIGLLQKIARGLRVEITDLLRAGGRPAAAGRIALTRAGEGEQHETPAHRHEMLCSTLARKRMLPFRSRIKARPDAALPPFYRHDSEELVVVLEGSVVLHSEFYAPMVLAPGDSIYLDARMGHCFVPQGVQDAVVLFVIAE